MTSAEAVPVAHTPPGGYGAALPAPILAGCAEPLVDGAPDLRGLWQVVAVVVDDAPAPADHPAYGTTQRIEQSGDRLVVTAAGVIHDMRCDGTEANGVNDVMQIDFTTKLTVVASYEHGVHVLRPKDMPGVEVTRARGGDQMVWQYADAFIARLDRIGDVDAPHPEGDA